MSMLKFVLFLLFPAIELYLLVKVGSMIGALNMVLWVFASAAIGMWAVRAQGQGSMMRVRADLAEGKVPQNPFVEGLLLFMGGVLLILPGLISDAVGLLLLIPPARHAAAGVIAKYLAAQQAKGQASRVIFFSSTGFPGAGGPGFGQRPTYQNNDFQRMDDGMREEDGPRQATVIESTAIDVTAQSAGASSEKEDGREKPDKE